ncbi:unnamed protein product [Adineta steineri]|uniref:Uncharacterized protein n=1 Tax=Adineta steineri TaxID=433720 RepID=A0A814MEM9_9BILA|nr:unnamed protein product [Adineta steineri]
MLTNKLYGCGIRLPFLHVRHRTNIARDNKNRKLSNENKTIHDRHLANITVTSFHSQTAIEQLALKSFFKIENTMQ